MILTILLKKMTKTHLKNIIFQLPRITLLHCQIKYQEYGLIKPYDDFKLKCRQLDRIFEHIMDSL